MVSLASGAVQVLLSAPATPPARSCETVPICFGGGCTNFRTPPSTATPTLASICISWFRFFAFLFSFTTFSNQTSTYFHYQKNTKDSQLQLCIEHYFSSLSSLCFRSAQNQTTTRSSSSSCSSQVGDVVFCDPD